MEEKNAIDDIVVCMIVITRVVLYLTGKAYLAISHGTQYPLFILTHASLAVTQGCLVYIWQKLTKAKAS